MSKNDDSSNNNKPDSKAKPDDKKITQVAQKKATQSAPVNKKESKKEDAQSKGNTQEKKKRSLVPLLALSISIVALAVVYFLHVNQQKILSQVADNKIEVKDWVTRSDNAAFQEELKQKTVATYDQIGQIKADAKQLADRLQIPEQNITRLEQEIDLLRAENKLIKGQLSHIPSTFSEAEVKWVVARVEFLVETASNQLSLLQDVSGAKKALSAAETLLRSTAEPSLLPLREKIRKDIQLLDAVPTVDVDTLIAQLNALIQDASQLAIADIPNRWPLKSTESDDGDLAEVAETYGQKVLSALRGVVDVRRGSDGAGLMLSPDQHFVLLQNIAIQLETAKAAVLTRNAKIYHGTLKKVRDSIALHFDSDHSHVKSVIQQLEQLQRTDVSPPLPKLEQSAAAIHQFQHGGTYASAVEAQ